MKIVILFLIFLLTGCSSSHYNNRYRNGEYNLIRGINSYENNDKNKALEEYHKSYKLNSKNPTLLREMAYLYMEDGQIESAIKFYEESLIYDPNNQIALKNLAYIFFKNSEFDKTKSTLKKIVSSKNDDFCNKINGYIEFNLKNYHSSFEYLSKVSKKSFDEEYFLYFTELLFLLDKKEYLYHFYSKNYNDFKDNRDFIKRFSVILIKIFNNNDKSKEVLLAYLSEYKKDDELLAMLSKIYIAEKNFKKAEETLQLISESYKYNTNYIELNSMLK